MVLECKKIYDDIREINHCELCRNQRFDLTVMSEHEPSKVVEIKKLKIPIDGVIGAKTLDVVVKSQEIKKTIDR